MVSPSIVVESSVPSGPGRRTIWGSSLGGCCSLHVNSRRFFSRTWNDVARSRRELAGLDREEEETESLVASLLSELKQDDTASD